MGYEVGDETIFVLQFGDKFDGLEIKAASLTFGELLDLGDQPDRVRAGAGLAEVRDLVAQFGKRLRSWNLTRNGQPIPVSTEELLALGPRLAMSAVLAWCNGMVDVDDDLGKGSTSGRPSAPPNFPMEAP